MFERHTFIKLICQGLRVFAANRSPKQRSNWQRVPNLWGRRFRSLYGSLWRKRWNGSCRVMEVWSILKCSGFSVGCLVGFQQNLWELSMVKFFLRLKAPNLFETLSCAGRDTFLAFWSKDGIHTRFLQCQIGVDQWILLKSWERSFQAQRDISRWAKGADQRSGCLEWWFGAKKRQP